VLVAIGERKQLKRFCGLHRRKRIHRASSQFTGKLAAAVGASVTLLHVMAEPPAMYADLVRMEKMLVSYCNQSRSLGTNLRRQKRELDRLGVSAEVHLRTESSSIRCFEEVRDGDYDLIVTGIIAGARVASALHHGRFNPEHFEPCQRPGARRSRRPPKAARTLWKAIKGLFGSR